MALAKPSISDVRAYHILTYGTLLGSNLFQTFLAGPVAFQALPRPQFSSLQQAIFPIYFSIQTGLPILLALTFPPGQHRVASIASGGRGVASVHGGIGGLLAHGNRWTAFYPILAMFGSSLLNLLVLGPATTKVMKQRKHQETRDGKKYYESGPQSAEMQRLNASFAKLHGAASLSNVLGLGAMIVYAFTLACQL